MSRAELPSWDEARGLIIGYPKPAIKGTVDAPHDGRQHRSAQLMHDGHEGWLIEEEDRREIVFNDRSAMWDQSGESMRAVHGPRVSSSTWIKSMIQGRLLAHLDTTTGTVVGSDSVASRECWVADVDGLRGDDTTFTLWIDKEYGLILRLESAEGAKIEFRKLEIVAQK